MVTEIIYAIVEIYGHQCYAGILSEHKTGDNSFVRIDVPASGNKQPYTKLFNQKAIFSITPVDEATAKLWLSQHNQDAPVYIYRTEVLISDENNGDNHDPY